MANIESEKSAASTSLTALTSLLLRIRPPSVVTVSSADIEWSGALVEAMNKRLPTDDCPDIEEEDEDENREGADDENVAEKDWAEIPSCEKEDDATVDVVRESDDVKADLLEDAANESENEEENAAEEERKEEQQEDDAECIARFVEPLKKFLNIR